jgi:hypothetical protein
MAVQTVVGLVQYTRMTIGLKNAGGFFQRLVNNVYAGLKGRSLQAYLDDIAVGSTRRRRTLQTWEICESKRRTQG